MNKQFWIIFLTFLLIINGLNRVYGQSNNRYSIIISEIMADPTPSIGLPAAEYIELHNRNDSSVTLVGWRITLGNTNKNLPSLTIPAKGYIAIFAEKYEEDMALFCPLYATLSSLSITDGGQSITLYDSESKVIDHVTFKRSWHSESIKQNGGWSLEIKDPEQPCLGAENWNSSTSSLGGTPGAPNAIEETLYDSQQPYIKSVTLITPQCIRIFFSETLHPDLTLPRTLFRLSPMIEIDTIQAVPPQFSALDIKLQDTLQQNTHYTLTLNGPLCDCAKNYITGMADIRVGIPSHPKYNDLIINEILSHPKDGYDADYIEILNHSQNIIDLKDIKIGSGGDTIPNKAVCAVGEGRQLFPGEYCCLCKDKQTTLSQYNCIFPHALVSCDSLPAYANSYGVVFLCDQSLRTIDRLAYSEEMHYAKLESTEGVSLERISDNKPTQNESNWHSASYSSGFGTPGYPNSQHYETDDDLVFLIEPEVFSPNNDGFEDFVIIHFTQSEPDSRLSINICNSYGQIIKHLVNNELCGVDNLFRWDGEDDHGQLMPSGMYIIMIQGWSLSGKTWKKKKVVAIRR